MKDYEVKVLDENDHIFIETLRNLGMSRNVATTMAYLMNVDEASSREIEISTGLRQPEVSHAMRLIPHFFLVIPALINCSNAYAEWPVLMLSPV